MKDLAKQATHFRYVVGTRLMIVDATPKVVYPMDRAARGRLSALLTLGNRQSPKGECLLYVADIAEYAEALLFLAVAGTHPLKPDEFVLRKLNAIAHPQFPATPAKPKRSTFRAS
jgi:error-prone DNA polymerase